MREAKEAQEWKAVRKDALAAAEDVQAKAMYRRGRAGWDTADLAIVVGLAEIAGALGADLVLHGDLGRLGSQYNLNIVVVSARSAEVWARLSELLPADDDDLAQRLPTLVQQVVESMALVDQRER